MQQLMVDADLDAPEVDYTPEEHAWRAAYEVRLRAAHERGERAEFTTELGFGEG